MKEMLEVRCCCDATKLLGYLPRPKGGVLRFQVPVSNSPSSFYELPDVAPVVLLLRVYELRVDEITTVKVSIDPSGKGETYVRTRYDAIKAEDHVPLEALRTLPDFVEAK